MVSPRRPRKTYNEVIKKDLKERKIEHSQAQKCLKVFHKKLSNSCKYGKQTLKGKKPQHTEQNHQLKPPNA